MKHYWEKRKQDPRYSAKCMKCDKSKAIWNKVEVDNSIPGFPIDFCIAYCGKCKDKETEKETAEYNRQQLGKLFN